ncbi:protein PEAK3 [Choloepus didactylus]|uniref:protein PEAK3 n=1 Tax=Choloepus didactylus TaxID=27675 RepID=UPI00189CED42|nr:protein PEAK3 [Choloepus didactylus]XP_037680108.1 protein PEAK3 [Choloepus didactylus]XP_037680109.1 protein PEAK3 [Choloepus didactylus]XP_037680110.1 protein PEAK3 [Choloepus didactylus]
MSRPDPPTETLGPDDPTWSAQPTYSNLGEVRAHLLPSKACRPRTTGSLSTDPQPLPPPLPKKTLARAHSLPTHKTLVPSPAQAGQPQRPLLGSLSVDKSLVGGDEAGRTSPPAELTFSTPDAELGRFFHDLRSPEAVHTVLAARHLEGLCTIHARLRARFMGGRPGPCSPGHSFRLLDSSPCADGGDALYYRVVRVDGEAWHTLAAKVPKTEAEDPNPWGLELQASLAPHFNLQGLCGLLPQGALTAAPWRGSVALTVEVPERTAAQWLAEVGARRPAGFVRDAALLLLQLSAALQRLEARGAALAELRPENLLLAAPRGCTGAGPPRLLLADFGRVRPRAPGPPGPHAPQLGRLLRALLGPAPPLATPLAAGLERLAAQLPRARPSAAQTRGALQALLWGPGPELHGLGVPLGSWLQVRRALLTLHLAERAAGGEAPGLEDWLACEYLAEATEASLGRALALLWD